MRPDDGICLLRRDMRKAICPVLGKPEIDAVPNMINNTEDGRSSPAATRAAH